MKKILLTLSFIVCHLASGVAYNQVRLVINDGINNQQLKEKMERAVSYIMTEINSSYERNQSRLVFTYYISNDAQNELNKLWENEHFQCVEEEIVERLLTTRTGYQVRGIPLIVRTADKSEELGYQEAVINFDVNGDIISFYYTINPELYSRLRINQSGDKRYEVTDLKNRMMILDYVEHFRTAYNQKDLKFLNQVFSDDALIIVGKVIKVQKSEVKLPNVIYIQQTKHEYLKNLERIFKRSRNIKVNFDDITIVSHPTINGIYGVTVHQRWKSSGYSDEGYVFMMWDFRNPEEPKIHVRTWQPDFIDKARGQKMNPNDVFTLGDFDL